jgi:hypothetical protein
MDSELIERFAVAISSNTVSGGSIVATANQTGGQVAHSITNIHLGGLADQQPRLAKDLRARNLEDPTASSFGITRYSQRVGIMDKTGTIAPLSVLGIFFAFTPGRLCPGPIADSDLLAWMDSNKRRYEPFPASPFIPVSGSDRIGKAHIWHDAHRQGIASPRCYTRYLALECEGYVEYGFYPTGWTDAEADRVYFAKVLAGFVAFLHFARDLCSRAGLQTSGTSIGFALRGTREKKLLCITNRIMEHFQSATPPDQDGFLFLHLGGAETDWTISDLAREAAESILDCWSYCAPGGTDTPEFKGSIYSGECFKTSFQSF